jgi:hypothetical protein
MRMIFCCGISGSHAGESEDDRQPSGEERRVVSLKYADVSEVRTVFIIIIII